MFSFSAEGPVEWPSRFRNQQFQLWKGKRVPEPGGGPVLICLKLPFSFGAEGRAFGEASPLPVSQGSCRRLQYVSYLLNQYRSDLLKILNMLKHRHFNQQMQNNVFTSSHLPKKCVLPASWTCYLEIQAMFFASTQFKPLLLSNLTLLMILKIAAGGKTGINTPAVARLLSSSNCWRDHFSLCSLQWYQVVCKLKLRILYFGGKKVKHMIT